MKNTDKVPFLDLVNLHKSLEPELQGVFNQAVKTGWFVGGPEVEGFEKEFAEFCGAFSKLFKDFLEAFRYNFGVVSEGFG